MPQSAPSIPSRQVDATVLLILGALQTLAIALALLLSGLTFLNWIVPPLGDQMPDFFRLMRANNSLLGVLCGLSLVLLQPRRSPNMVRTGQLLGGLVLLFAALILASDFGYLGLGINTLFAPDPTHPFPGRVSPEAAFTFILIGLVLLTLPIRSRPLTYLAECAALVLSLTVSFFLAGYILGLSHLFNIDPHNPFALQTYILISLLTAVACTRRTEFGVFDVLLAQGVGGQFARLAAPLALILPFAFAIGNASLAQSGALPDNVLTARSTSLVSLVAFCLVGYLAHRTDRLERTMREPILRDDLTHLYNRRGFTLLAETTLHLAHREGASFFLLFLDLDGLRRVNLELGHRTGSDFLRTMATLLEESFPGNHIIGRIGGDEFAIAGKGDPTLCARLIDHLDAAAADAWTPAGEPFTIAYSLGSTFSSRRNDDNLIPLLQKAERSMQEAKRTKLFDRNHEPLARPAC